MSQKQSFWH